jgi:hypothetical protein
MRLLKYTQKYKAPINSYMFRHWSAILRKLFWQRSVRPARLTVCCVAFIKTKLGDVLIMATVILSYKASGHAS